jgi:serine/threonine-protein kinase SRPK3
LEPNKYVAIKICTCTSAKDEDTRHELDITIHISSANSTQPGRAIIGTAIEAFGLDSHTGSTHLCLVFEPMREPLWVFRRLLAGEDRVTRLSLPLIKTYLQILLEGLDYLHSE